MTGQLISALPRKGTCFVYGGLSQQPVGAIPPMDLIYHQKRVEGWLLPNWLRNVRSRALRSRHRAAAFGTARAQRATSGAHRRTNGRGGQRLAHARVAQPPSRQPCPRAARNPSNLRRCAQDGNLSLLRKLNSAASVVNAGLAAPDGWSRTQFVDCSMDTFWAEFLKLWSTDGFTNKKLRVVM